MQLAQANCMGRELPCMNATSTHDAFVEICCAIAQGSRSHRVCIGVGRDRQLECRGVVMVSGPVTPASTTTTYPPDLRGYQSAPDVITALGIMGTGITLSMLAGQESFTLGRADACHLRANAKYLAPITLASSASPGDTPASASSMYRAARTTSCTTVSSPSHSSR